MVQKTFVWNIVLSVLLITSPIVYMNVLTVEAHDPNHVPVFVDKNTIDFADLLDTSMPVFHTVISESHSRYSLEVIVRDPDAGEKLTIQRPLLANIRPEEEVVSPDVIPGLVAALPTQTILVKRFHWDLSTLLDDDAASFPKYLGVTLVAQDVHGRSTTPSKPLYIAVVVYKDQFTEPTITFDRSKYFQESMAEITIFDPTMNRNADLTVLERITATTESPVVTNPPQITLEEVSINDDPGAPAGTFKTRFLVSDHACTPSVGPGNMECEPFTVKYGNGPNVVESEQIDISPVQVELSNTQFNIDETVTITVTDPSAGTDAGTVTVSSSNSPTPLEIPLSSAGGDTFTGTFRLSLDTASAVTGSSSDEPGGSVLPTFETQGGEDITVQYESPSGSFENENIARVFDGISISFDRDESTPYHLDEKVSIRVVDKDANIDPQSVERTTTPATVTSSADAPGFPGVEIELQEDGIDSAIFQELTYLGFTTGDSDNAGKLIKVFEDRETLLTLSYRGFTHTASVVPFFNLPAPDPAGFGGESNPVPAEPFSPAVTNLSCSSFGGDGADHDGICAYWEAPSKTYLTIQYPVGGSWHQFQAMNNPVPHSSTKDLLIEIDEIDQSGGGGLPANVRTEIKNFFDSNGIKLQFSPTSEAITLASNLLIVWADAGTDDPPADSFEEIKETKFGDSSSERLGTDRGKAKKQVFHYVVYGKTAKQAWNQASSGIAEIIGDDFIVTLGNWPAASEDKQKGTFMHELGHNLGLHHGGGTEHQPDTSVAWALQDYAANCKPNYLSPMSYGRQFPSAGFGFTLGPWDASYSNDQMTTMASGNDMDNLDENNGPNPTIANTEDIAWGRNSGGSRVADHQDVVKNPTGTQDQVDWNRVGGITSGVNEDLIDFGIPGCNAANVSNAPGGVITGFNDWQSSPTHLVLDFRVHGTANWGISDFSETNEMTYEIWNEILQLGIKSLDAKIQLLDESVFSDGNNTRNEISELLLGGSSGDPSGSGNGNIVSYDVHDKEVIVNVSNGDASRSGSIDAISYGVVPHAYAQQGTTVTTSAAKFFGEGILQVMVDDPDAEGGETTVEIEAMPEFGASNSSSITVPEVSDGRGIFEFFLVHNNATAIAPGDLDPINNNGVEGDGNCMIKCAPFVTFGPNGQIAVDSDMYEKTEFAIISGGTVRNVDYNETIGTLQVAQDSLGSANLVNIFVRDQDANLNPTGTDEFHVDPDQAPNKDLFTLSGGTIEDAVVFEETTDNSGIFEGEYQLGSSIQVTNNTLVLTLSEKANYGADLDVPENDSGNTDQVTFNVPMPDENVMSDIANGDMRKALDKLLDVYERLDGNAGTGDPSNDWIVDDDAKAFIREYLTTNIQTIANELYDKEFTLGSRDDSGYHIVIAQSKDVKPESSSITIIPDQAIADISVKGEGDVDLWIQEGLVQWNDDLTKQNTAVVIDGNEVKDWEIKDPNNSFYASVISIKIVGEGLHSIVIGDPDVILPRLPEDNSTSTFGQMIVAFAIAIGIFVVFIYAYSRRKRIKDDDETGGVITGGGTAGGGTAGGGTAGGGTAGGGTAG